MPERDESRDELEEERIRGVGDDDDMDDTDDVDEDVDEDEEGTF
jgi:hypothetical protein